jgi:type IV pilus assembly protein PilX
MMLITTSAPRRQRGIALIAAILILLVITILGMAMFRSYGMQQRIGGNSRDKSRAFHAAMSSQNFAEWYLTQNNGANAATTGTCTGTADAVKTATPVTGSTLMTPMVCSNVIPTTVAYPDTWGAAFTYTPTGMNTTSGTTYAQVPQFYISALGSPSGGTAYKSPIGQTQALFQIDAAGWGGTPQAVAVVESSFIVSAISTTVKPSTSGQIRKNVFLGRQQ